MPRYDYKCASCNKTIEIIQSIHDKPKRKCPKCGRLKLRRLISTGVGLIFKGEGFYRSVDYINQKAKEDGMIHGGSPRNKRSR